MNIPGFDCINETLGVGKIGDTVTGPCEQGLEGRITYQCKEIKLWMSIHSDCVVKAIQDLGKKVEVNCEPCIH